MVLTKRFLLRLFFGIEIVILTLMYLFGAQGLQALVRIRKENVRLAFEVQELEFQVKEVETTVIAWEMNPFYKEKAARENLHMARKQDKVYLIG